MIHVAYNLHVVQLRYSVGFILSPIYAIHCLEPIGSGDAWLMKNKITFLKKPNTLTTVKRLDLHKAVSKAKCLNHM